METKTPRGRQAAVARVAVILAAVVLVSLGHYLTSPRHFLLHNVYQRLYYIPILLSASWFGLFGGVLVASLCAAAYVPHILLHWAHSEAYQANQLLELGLFGVVALVAGVLSDRERSLRKEAEATAEERDRALRDLEATVESLRQADRLATLGTLTAGMAHEVRNPLGAIGGALEILRADFAPDHPRREFMEILEREFSRLNVITGKYLDFARPQSFEPRPLNLDAAVQSAVQLVRHSAERAGVRIETKAAPELPSAFADAVQLHQALVNLVLNGIQAMPEGGLLEIATESVPSGVRISVRDHGTGLPEGPVERIFEPFFSTRPGGTGLGLAMSRRIAVAHGGNLIAENAEGEGAVFRLTLPRATPRPGLRRG